MDELKHSVSTDVECKIVTSIEARNAVDISLASLETSIQLDKTLLPPLNDSWDEVLADWLMDDGKMSDVHSSKEYMDISMSCSDETKELSYPHVPYSVEELSFVTSLVSWSNTNVRVVGRIKPARNRHTWELSCIGEGGQWFCIDVDISFLKTQPPEGRMVQVFGKVQILPQAFKPTIIARFFRSFETFDLHYYNQSVNVFRERVPLFIKRT